MKITKQETFGQYKIVKSAVTKWGWFGSLVAEAQRASGSAFKRNSNNRETRPARNEQESEEKGGKEIRRDDEKPTHRKTARAMPSEQKGGRERWKKKKKKRSCQSESTKSQTKEL